MSRELARGVMWAVQSASGRYPRPAVIWPRVVGLLLYVAIAVGCVALSAQAVWR